MLSNEDIKNHIAIVGKTAHGKSTIIFQLAKELVYKKKGFAVLDPHGDLVENNTQNHP